MLKVYLDDGTIFTFTGTRRFVYGTDTVDVYNQSESEVVAVFPLRNLIGVTNCSDYECTVEQTSETKEYPYV